MSGGPATSLPFTVVDPATCALRGDSTGLEYRRLYDAVDGVCGICWQAPGFDHSAHWHSADELIYSISGRAFTLMGEEEEDVDKVYRGGKGKGGRGIWVSVEAGQCIVPASMVAHRTRTQPGASYECLYFFPDGPQDGRRYYNGVSYEGAACTADDDNACDGTVACKDVASAAGTGEHAVAGVPHVSVTKLADIDLEVAVWCHLVRNKARWSAAIVVLAAGAAATSARQHTFCYVLQGCVRCDDGDGGVAIARQSQLVRVNAAARARWFIAAEDGRTARVLLCVHDSHNA